MRKRFIVFTFILAIFLTGCNVFFVAQPSTAISGERITATFTLSNTSSSPANREPIACVELPNSWSVFSVSYTGINDSSAISGVPVENTSDSSSMASTHPTAGMTWSCFRGPSADYEGDAYADVSFEIDVSSDASGEYILRYAAGSVEDGLPYVTVLSIESLTKRMITVNLSSDQLEDWTLSGVSPNSSATIASLAFGNNTYVAVRNSGTIRTSSDFVTWSTQTSGTTDFLNKITFGGGLFVVVGNNGIILTSPDGTNWTSQTSGTTRSLSGVSYENGLYLAYGENSTMLTSSDGENWTSQTTGVLSALYDVCYDNGVYIAVGDAGAILTSPDAVTWTTQVSNTNQTLRGVTVGDGTIAAVGTNGTIMTSPDGISWTEETTGSLPTLLDVIYAAGKYVLVGDEGTIVTSVSTDDSEIRNSGTTEALSSVIYAQDRFHIAGSRNLVIRSEIIDSDMDGDPDSSDCNDSDATIFTGASETCDGVDTDCDGSLVDEFSDTDGDGIPDCVDVDVDGDGEQAVTDCDDSDPTIFTGAEEIADDGIDQDCDGNDTITCSVDADGDGFGSAIETVLSDDGDCTDSGESTTTTDCADDNADVNPSATEVCGDGVDNDCSGDDLVCEDLPTESEESEESESPPVDGGDKATETTSSGCVLNPNTQNDFSSYGALLLVMLLIFRQRQNAAMKKKNE